MSNDNMDNDLFSNCFVCSKDLYLNQMLNKWIGCEICYKDYCIECAKGKFIQLKIDEFECIKCITIIK